MGKNDVKLSDLVFPAYRNMWNSTKTYKVLKGSKGSGKSKFAALWHIYYLMTHPESNVLAIRKVFGTCKDSVYTDLLWAIEKLGVLDYWSYTVNPLQLTYKPTGQVVLFRGLDDPLKLASITVLHGIITSVWFEEAFEIMDWQAVLKVMMSIRGRMPEGYHKSFMFTFNPWNEHHWLKTEFFDHPERTDTDLLTTTFRDNRMLDDMDIKRYMDLYDTNPRAARIICDGDWGRTEGLIYDNWTEEEFDPYEILRTRKVQPTFGLDFGYSISFNAFVAILVDVDERELWLYDEWYCNGVSNLDVAKALIEKGYGKEHIWADAAEPKSIYELRTGLVEVDDKSGEPVMYRLPNINQALKGPDSVRQGISTLQGFKMHIHTKCINSIMNFSNYAWKQNKDGTYSDEPAKEWDHIPDACRYAMAAIFVRGRGKVVEAKGYDNPDERPAYKSKRVVSTVRTY